VLLDALGSPLCTAWLDGKPIGFVRRVAPRNITVGA
jgi:hypothetical protein